MGEKGLVSLEWRNFACREPPGHNGLFVIHTHKECLLLSTVSPL